MASALEKAADLQQAELVKNLASELEKQFEQLENYLQEKNIGAFVKYNTFHYEQTNLHNKRKNKYSKIFSPFSYIQANMCKGKNSSIK